MAMKIIYLTTVSYTKQLKADLFIDKVSEKYDVFLFSIKMISDRDYALEDDAIDYYSIESMDDLKKQLNAIHGFKVVITDLSLKSLSKYCQILKNNQVQIVHIKKDNFQNYVLRNSIIYNKKFHQKIIMMIKKVTLFSKIINRIIYGKCKYDYLLSEKNYFPFSTKVFKKIHHIKYDDFLNEKNKIPYLTSEYAVFLDSNIPFHPDILKHMKSESVNPDYYFKLLNNFFNHIEKKFKLEIIISAHPKSNYNQNTFKGRKIIKYMTTNLIENSKFVLSHATTSVITSVLFKKPIIFLYYNEMLIKGSRLWTIATIEYSKMLNAPLVDLENNVEFVISIDNKKYEKFEEDFIVNRHHLDKSNSKMILETLHEIEIKFNY